MSTVDDILKAYRQMPVDQRSCDDLQRKLHDQGVEAWMSQIRALLSAVAATETRHEDLVGATAVLRYLSDVARHCKCDPSDFELYRELAREITTPLTLVHEEETIDELRHAIASLLDCVDQAREMRRQLAYYEQMELLRQREDGNRSQTESSAESGRPADPPNT